MKTKGITIWEKYAEFLVLAVVFVVLVIYIIGQIASPNVKEVAGRSVAPGDWYEKLKETGELIKRDQEPKKMVPPEVDKAIKTGEKTSSVTLQGFNDRMASRVGPVEAGILPDYQLVPRIVGGDAKIGSNARFVDAQLPPASKPIVYQTFDLLSDGVASENESLQQIVGDTPHDISWLTVASEFDVAEAVRRYTTAGSGGELPLPDRWHNGRIDLLDIRIERQELVAGEWTGSEVIEALPGQFSLRERLARESELGAEDRDEILAMLIDESMSSQISQPDFYPTEESRWLEPPAFLEEEAVNQIQQDDSMDSAARLRQIKLRKLARLEKERDKLIEKFGEGGGPGAGSGLGSSSGGGSNSGGSRGGAGGGKDAGTDAAAKARARIERLKKEVEELRAELGIVEEDPFDDSSDKKATSDDEAVKDPSEATGWVWGYDISALPGRTYRYRVTLAVYNPLFARKLSLVEEQEQLAESMVKLIDASEWSAPYMVIPSLQVLAVRAMPSGYEGNSGRLGYGEATAEVWRFYEGQWWPRRFSIQPGDVIGGIAPPDGQEPGSMDPIDFSTEWFVVDVLPRTGASKSDARYGKGAKIIIQNRNNGSRMVIDPVEDAVKQRPGNATF